MAEVIPEGRIGNAWVEHVKITYKDSNLPSGTYAVLYINNEVVMADDVTERNTNYPFVQAAHGNVLIAGLGLGMIVHAIKDKVDKITVVEINSDVIAMVTPSLPNEIIVINADIYNWTPSEKYDTIYFDIWNKDVPENKLHSEYLHQKAEDWKSYPFAWVGSWGLV
jgi:spermidine synthase